MIFKFRAFRHAPHKKCNSRAANLGVKVSKPEKKRPPQATSLGVVVGKPTKKGNMTQMTSEEQVTVTLNPTTDAGTPAKLDGAPVWSVVEGDVVLIPAADGMSCVVQAGAENTDSIVQVDGDADLGAGVTDLQAQLVFHVVHAAASNLGISISAPVPKATLTAAQAKSAINKASK